VREGTKKSIQFRKALLETFLMKMTAKGTELSSVPSIQNGRISMETILIFMLVALITGLLVGVTVARPALIR